MNEPSLPDPKPPPRLESIWNHEGGFTLVEELVTVAVIGLGLAILVSMITTGAVGVRKVDDLVRAETLARSQSELIKAAPYQSDPTASPYPSVTPVSGYSVDVTLEYWNQNTDAFTSVVRDDGLQKAIITVSADGEALLQITTYKVDR